MLKVKTKEKDINEEKQIRTLEKKTLINKIEELGLKEFVVYEEDGSPKSLAYASMVTLLTKAIQEQQAMIISLQDRLDKLENK